MLLPGATTSGFTKPSCHVGPRELYADTSSSAGVTVPFVLPATTVIADGALPGEVTPAQPARTAIGRPVVRSYGAVMRPLNAGSGAMPESITATPIPAPFDISPSPSVLRRTLDEIESVVEDASPATPASAPIDSTFGLRASSASWSPLSSAVNAPIDGCFEKILLPFDNTSCSTLVPAPALKRTMTRWREPPCASCSTRSSLGPCCCAAAGGGRPHSSAAATPVAKKIRRASFIWGVTEQLLRHR